MLGSSSPAYIWIRTWVFILHLIAPLSVTYCVLIPWLHPSLRLPTILEFVAIAEAVFYYLTKAYQRYYLQRQALHPPLPSREERDKLFERCQDTTQDYVRYMSKWFLDVPLALIKQDNLKEFFRWAFLNTTTDDPIYDEEVEGYIERLELRSGISFEPGRANVKCLRLTIDKVDALHRSLTWYMCILVVDVLTHTYMACHQFGFHRSSLRHCFGVFPPRPQTFFAPGSPAKRLSYWYRPHNTETELPILFLHGIGVGLYPYMQFLDELNRGRPDNTNIGIVAIELLPVSSRVVPAMLGKEDMCQQIRLILSHHGIDKFVLVSHSYGSVISTHLLKSPDMASRISSIVLVDPVSILLHQPDVAYNFIFRKPKSANEWLLWYFGSKDMGTAHTLSRRFFWSENILWKEDLLGRPATVFLSGQDSIINAPLVREYLQPSEQRDCANSLKEASLSEDVVSARRTGQLEVVWATDLDHGEVFDSIAWRALLKKKVLMQAS